MLLPFVSDVKIYYEMMFMLYGKVLQIDQKKIYDSLLYSNKFQSIDRMMNTCPGEILIVFAKAVQILVASRNDENSNPIKGVLTPFVALSEIKMSQLLSSNEMEGQLVSFQEV